jgi:hypothetical protein
MHFSALPAISPSGHQDSQFRADQFSLCGLLASLAIRLSESVFMTTTSSTNASGLFSLCLVLGFLIALALTNGLIDRLAWAVGGGW